MGYRIQVLFIPNFFNTMNSSWWKEKIISLKHLSIFNFPVSRERYFNFLSEGGHGFSPGGQGFNVTKNL